jgi:ferredoxin
MTQNIIKKVDQCSACRMYFEEGLEGEDGLCDPCRDLDESDHPRYDVFIETDNDKPQP